MVMPTEKGLYSHDAQSRWHIMCESLRMYLSLSVFEVDKTLNEMGKTNIVKGGMDSLKDFDLSLGYFGVEVKG